MKKGFLIAKGLRRLRNTWRSKHGSRSCTKKEIVLVEFNQIDASFLHYSSVANCLQQKKVEIKTYTCFGEKTYLIRMYKGLRLCVSGWKELTAWILLGAGFPLIPYRKGKSQEAREHLDKRFGNIHTKKDVEALHLRGVYVGDLVYDEYLKRYQCKTISVSDRRLMDVIEESLIVVDYWRGFIEKNSVSAVIVSHCVYFNAIVLRVALMMGIECFQVTERHVHRLTGKKWHAYTEFKSYPLMFKRLDLATKMNGLKEAKNRIERRFKGEVGVDMSYSTASAYHSEAAGIRVLRRSNRLKVLIAAHCFLDSPHSYGNNLFCDFHDWLLEIGRLSEECDYDWYIKSHRDFQPRTHKFLEEFCAEFRNIEMIPSDTSHNQLIEEGIGLVLTVYGTIGFEYAAKGIKVINASLNSPHIGYSFNFHPRTAEEFRYMVRNVERLESSIEETEIHEYYYMRYIHGSINCIGMSGDEVSRVEKESGRGYSDTCLAWLELYNRADYSRLKRVFSAFRGSKDFILSNRHFLL